MATATTGSSRPRGRSESRLRSARRGSVTISSGALEATFLPDLGMLGTSLRSRGRELLALPGGVGAYRHRRMTGLPIMAPWANRLGAWRYRVGRHEVDLEGLDLATDEHGLPIHGNVAAVPWEVVRRDTGATTATLAARLHYTTPELLAAFPFPHRLELEASVEDAAMVVRTTLCPTGRRSVPVSFGFHPYFRLPEDGRDSWVLELPAGRRLVLDERGLPTGEREEVDEEAAPLGRRSLDDLYEPAGAVRLAIASGGLRLVLEGDGGYRFAQIYAPRGRPFVCLEPMTAPTNALLGGRCPMVAPGESFTASFSVTIDGPGV